MTPVFSPSTVTPPIAVAPSYALGSGMAVDDLCDVAGGIHAFAERIARIQGIAEHTEALQRPRCSHLRRAERVSQFVDNRHGARSCLRRSR